MVLFVMEVSIKYRAISGHVPVLHKALDISKGNYFKSLQMPLQILDPPICLMTIA